MQPPCSWGRTSIIARPAAATRNANAVSSAGVSSLRSHTRRGGLTTRLPPFSRLTRSDERSGSTRVPPPEVNRVTLTEQFLPRPVINQCAADLIAPNSSGTHICTQRSYRGADRHTIVARSALRTLAPRARAAADRAVVDLGQYEDQRRPLRGARTRRRLALAVGHLSAQFHPRLRERHRSRPRRDGEGICRAVSGSPGSWPRPGGEGILRGFSGSPGRTRRQARGRPPPSHPRPPHPAGRLPP